MTPYRLKGQLAESNVVGTVLEIKFSPVGVLLTMIFVYCIQLDNATDNTRIEHCQLETL